MAEHHGISKEQAHALGKHERDLGSVDTGESMPVSRDSQVQPLTINVGWLPQEQPMCPHCRTGLHAVRQNPQGDTLFECVQPGCVGDGYMAVFRILGPRWEHYQGRYGAQQPEGWKRPVRFADLQALAQQEAERQKEPEAKPAMEWPKDDSPIHVQEAGVKSPVAASEGPGEPKESKSVQRRKAAQKAGKK